MYKRALRASRVNSAHGRFALFRIKEKERGYPRSFEKLIPVAGLFRLGSLLLLLLLKFFYVLGLDGFDLCTFFHLFKRRHFNNVAG